ncbi:hypothetical protein K505DRAFT_224045, partial [Melanomma pulvis-pyrius CBS 109.77]
DQRWSYLPDKTASWYKDNGKPLPKLAEGLTTVEDGQSYIVKLECLGCPFRLRTIGEVYETWQDPAQDNSLLLNFTIDASEPTLLLNGERIAPTPLLPLDLSAFQTPANLSEETMGKMASQHMLDSSWKLGTKYGKLELQYEHTILATESGAEMLQFDITGVHRRGINPGSFILNKKGQKLVQLLLPRLSTGEENPSTKLSIKDIQIVERKDRAQPLRMKCGKLAMIRTEYNPLEWDEFGQFGTLTRSWHRVLWGSASFFVRNLPYLIIFSIVFGCISIIRWHIKRAEELAVALANDDTEAALLAPEYDDAPPDYVD